MKKVFILLSLTASLGIASVFLFTRNDTRFSLFLQKFIKSPEEKVPLTLISIDNDFVQKFSSPFASNSIIEDAVIASRELGSTGHIKDFGYNKSFSKIFPQTLKTQINAQRETSLFGLKIVFPNQNNLNEDLKTPENYNPLTPQQKVHLIYKKGRQYYADSVFASLLENFDNSNLQIDNFSIKFADKSIPRIYDGSVLLKYPQTSYKNWNTVSVLELYNYKKSEEVFYSYLKLMSKRGLFGELNSENPLDIYETAESLKNKPGLKDYIYLKEKFYKLINSYLSGKQEKILIEETGDEEYREIICNSFKTCKTLFNNLEAERKNLISKINGSFCVFAVTADTLSDFISSPVDSKLPESLTAYVLAHMIYNDDFVDFLSPLLSFSLAVLLCLILAILSLKIKKAFPVIIIAAVFVIIFPAAVIFTYIKFKIYTGFFIITPSLLTYLLLTAIYALIKNKQEWLSLSSKITQPLKKQELKRFFHNKPAILSENSRCNSTILTSKILNLPTISSLLSDNQYTCFLNYYLENIFDQIMAFNGIIESYYTDFSIVSIFSPALFSENHCELALNTAFSIKDTDKKINADIKTIPLSPKIDGMNDDLYTAFFILNHNKVKVSTQTALFTDSINTGFTGAKEKFSFKICDNSWKEALSLCDFSQKTGLTGIIVNEKAGENLKNSCIIRKLNENYEVLGKLSDDNEKLWNYTKYWNQAMDLLEKGDKQKALAIFKKLNEGRPNDNAARYFIKLLEVVE